MYTFILKGIFKKQVEWKDLSLGSKQRKVDVESKI